jgi:2-polyprenyl-3-methyl-5-hydroxy-6-metoxy-1,4-benzoquinol methylase
VSEVQLDRDKMDAFGTKMRGILNASGTAMMLSLGHQAGVFDAMARLAPSTSEEIAHAAGCNERYVREWLGAMVAADIVSYDSTRDLYSLPPEHAAFTTRAGGPRNVATYAQFFPLLATVERSLLECFRHGGGVPYSEFADFHRVMGEISAQRMDMILVPFLLPLVPGLEHALGEGITVADVGCGSGHAVNVMAAAFPASSFVGIDFSEEAIGRASAEAAEMGLANATFEVADAAALGPGRRYDFMTTFDAVHDQAHPRRMVQGIFDSLAPGGYWLCADISASSHVGENASHPLGPFQYAVSCMHCMTVSLAYDGEGLGAMWGVQKAREIFTGAGFVIEATHQVPGDVSNNYYICRKPT